MPQYSHFIVHKEELWANFQYLIEKGVPLGTVKNGISKNRKGKSESWKFLKKGFYRYILVDSIPKQCKTKYKIEEDSKNPDFLPKKKINPNAGRILLVDNFTIVANNRWNRYMEYYEHYFPNHDLIKSLSKTHAVIEEIIQLHDSNKYKLIDLYEAYNRIPLKVNLYYRSASYSTFLKKIADSKIDGIHNVIPHKGINRESNALKFTQYWKNRAIKLYANPQKFTKTAIWEKINKERRQADEDQFSYPTIQSFLNSTDIQNATLKSRHGRREYRNKLLPYFQLTSESVNEIWQIDGLKIPFACLDNEQNIYFYDLVIVTDFYSRRIIGYSIGRNENTFMIKAAIKNSLLCTKSLPNQIVHDNFKAYNSIETTKLKDRMGMFGVIWNKTNNDSPREKGNIERTIGTLNTRHFREIYGYVGEGVKSIREYSIPSPEKLMEYRKKQNCYSINEITELVERCIHNYNEESVNGNASPRSLYDQSLSSNSKKYFKTLKDYHVPYLFYGSIKCKILKSTIKMKHKGDNYHYTLPAEFRNNLNNTRVEVFYDNNRDEIFIFSLNKECVFITSLSRNIKIPRNVESRNSKVIEYVNQKKADNIKYSKQFSVKVKSTIKKEENLSKMDNFYLPGMDDKSLLKDVQLSKFLEPKETEKLDIIYKNIDDINL